jgi:osmotically-inducible protein OsmY
VKKTSAIVLVLITGLSAVPLLVGLTGCAVNRNHSTALRIDDNRATEPGYNQTTDQGIEDSRTAARVREALAAGLDYKYDGVKVTASEGIVRLSGSVNTSAQRKSAGEITSIVGGVKSVENTLTVKN